MKPVRYAAPFGSVPRADGPRQSFITCGWLIGLLLALSLGGCAMAPVGSDVDETPIHAPAEEPMALGHTGVYWWYVGFRMVWPEGEEAPWHPDLWLADRVLGPVLEDEGAAIQLWRFHRRAARDSAGRQFSFIFRATPATAARVNERVRTDAVVRRMQVDGLLEAVLFDDPASPSRPGIGDTSDAAWSPEMQRTWPHFIMGVSRLWLELIRELERNSDWPGAPEARYAAIGDAVDALWRSEGEHALLHHLNAVFG